MKELNCWMMDELGNRKKGLGMKGWRNGGRKGEGQRMKGWGLRNMGLRVECGSRDKGIKGEGKGWKWYFVSETTMADGKRVEGNWEGCQGRGCCPIGSQRNFKWRGICESFCPGCNRCGLGKRGKTSSQEFLWVIWSSLSGSGWSGSDAEGMSGV